MESACGPSPKKDGSEEQRAKYDHTRRNQRCRTGGMYRANPETISTYPDKMMRWKGISAILDTKPGGVYRVDMNGRDGASGPNAGKQKAHDISWAFSWRSCEDY